MASTMFELLTLEDRTRTYTGSLYAADGVTPFVLGSSDKLRVKIGKFNTVLLDLVSGTVLSGGSTVHITSLGSSTAAATYTFTIAQSDATSLVRGAYAVEVLLVDGSDGLAKTICLGILHVLTSMSGGLT